MATSLTDRSADRNQSESGVPGLTAVLDRIGQLRTPGPEDDAVPPTQHASDRVQVILRETAAIMSQQRRAAQDATWEFPSGYATTDDDGGIRIEWWHELTHGVHLVVGAIPDSREYLFAKFGMSDQGNLERPADPQRLATLLHQLNSARASRG